MDAASRSARKILMDGLAELSIESTGSQLVALVSLARLLERWADRINLTGHRTREAIVQRLILDAAALAVHLPPLRTLADIGSGAGFPGLPLAILRPDCRVTLVESRERRHHFQKAAIRELRLKNVVSRLGRAEILEPTLHEAAVAQAVATPAKVLPLLLRWTEPAGILLFPGSIPPPPAPDDPRIQVEKCLEYSVPLAGPARSLWLARRTQGDF